MKFLEGFFKQPYVAGGYTDELVKLYLEKIAAENQVTSVGPQKLHAFNIGGSSFTNLARPLDFQQNWLLGNCCFHLCTNRKLHSTLTIMLHGVFLRSKRHATNFASL